MAILELKNIVKQFADYTAVNGVSLSIEQGEFFTLLGPSGCGKTTLLRMVAGFESPDSGQILLDGKDIKDLPSTYLKAKRLVKEKLGPLGFYLQGNVLNRVHRTARNLTDFVSFLNNYKK